MSTHNSEKDTPREPRRMRVIDWIMVVGGVLVALVMTYNSGWQAGLIAFFLYMFLFALARFIAAMFRRRKTRR